MQGRFGVSELGGDDDYLWQWVDDRLRLTFQMQVPNDTFLYATNDLTGWMSFFPPTFGCGMNEKKTEAGDINISNEFNFITS